MASYGLVETVDIMVLYMLIYRESSQVWEFVLRFG